MTSVQRLVRVPKAGPAVIPKSGRGQHGDSRPPCPLAAWHPFAKTELFVANVGPKFMLKVFSSIHLSVS